MKYLVYFLFTFALVSDTEPTKQALVDYDSFEKLVTEVKEHRKARLVSLEKFLEMAKDKNTIILDTRSSMLYKGKHIKGAKNLNFSDFTVTNLARVIPSYETRILIYCNNNFEDDPVFFATKMAPVVTQNPKSNLTLALNIPTYINLFGYGYKNVYELSELVSINDSRVELEGSSVRKK
jgi:hypothetical protein